MQTGQISLATGNWVPQTKQVRVSSTFMVWRIIIRVQLVPPSVSAGYQTL
jgi:hypothetical protein